MTTRYTGINHLALATGNMDQTILFWRDLLGMRIVAELGNPGYRHYFFEVSKHDLIAFFEWPSVEPVQEKEHGRPIKGPFIFDHVSIGVETEAHLWEIKDRINAAGIWISEVIDHGFIHSVYSFDPNGIPIEFSCPVAGIDMRRSPLMADSNPSPIAKEGSEPHTDKWPVVEKRTPKEEQTVYPGQGSEFFHGTQQK